MMMFRRSKPKPAKPRQILRHDLIVNVPDPSRGEYPWQGAPTYRKVSIEELGRCSYPGCSALAEAEIRLNEPNAQWLKTCQGHQEKYEKMLLGGTP